MSPVEFEPTISAGERPETYAVDRAATGIGESAHEGDKVVSPRHRPPLPQDAPGSYVRPWVNPWTTVQREG
jgi:hypothetical protein